MDKRRLYLGIDTSNYKTSVALIDDDLNIVHQRSELLEVKPGSRGLRQSEAFYQHSMRLPAYIEEALDAADGYGIAAIAYSAWPRRQQGSYMPCFNAGINAAQILSSALSVPAYPFSHQEGHAAVIIPREESGRTLFMHLSGGTTEFLITVPDEHGYDMSIAGGTKDISFGQLLDRAGVALGYPFPAGGFLDSAAASGKDVISSGSLVFPRIKIDDGHFNLSGAEAKVLRYIEENDLSAKDPADSEAVASLAAGLMRYIADILIRSSEAMAAKYGIDTVYMAGGEASSITIREIINDRNSDAPEIRFGDPALSGDNAVGTARLAEKIHNINETGKRIPGK